MSLILIGESLSHLLKTKTQYYGSFNKKIQTMTEQLQSIASKSRINVLTANQIGFDKSIFVYSTKSKANPSEYNVIFNPQITGISSDMITQYEDSPSFPYFKMMTKRHKYIQVSYDTQIGRTIKKDFEGEEALLFQQGNDQLMGIHPMCWCVSHGEIVIHPEYNHIKLDSFMKIFDEYSNQGKKYKEERTLFQLNLNDDLPNYPMEGPTHPIECQQLQDDLLTKLEMELFYST